MGQPQSHELRESSSASTATAAQRRNSLSDAGDGLFRDERSPSFPRSGAGAAEAVPSVPLLSSSTSAPFLRRRASDGGGSETNASAASLPAAGSLASLQPTGAVDLMSSREHEGAGGESDVPPASAAGMLGAPPPPPAAGGSRWLSLTNGLRRQSASNQNHHDRHGQSSAAPRDALDVDPNEIVNPSSSFISHRLFSIPVLRFRHSSGRDRGPSSTEDDSLYRQSDDDSSLVLDDAVADQRARRRASADRREARNGAPLPLLGSGGDEPPSLVDFDDTHDLAEDVTVQLGSPSPNVPRTFNAGMLNREQSLERERRVNRAVLGGGTFASPHHRPFASANLAGNDETSSPLPSAVTPEPADASPDPHQDHHHHPRQRQQPRFTGEPPLRGLHHSALRNPSTTGAATPQAAVTFDNQSASTGGGAVFFYHPSRRGSVGSVATSVGGTTLSSDADDDNVFGGNAVAGDFFPQPSPDYEWMGRSIETLVLGHASRAAMLHLAHEDDDQEHYYSSFNSPDPAFRRRSTASTFGGGGGGGGGGHPPYGRRRSSQGSFPGGRRGSLSLSGTGHGGTLANYYSRRQRQGVHQSETVDRTYTTDRAGAGGYGGGRRGSVTSNTPMYRRRSSVAGAVGGAAVDEAARRPVGAAKGGPNVVYSIMARESTGKSCFQRGSPNASCLRSMGGNALYGKLDKPADGMATEIAFLAAAIDSGDWTETQTIISRLAPRIIGDAGMGLPPSERAPSIEDPNLPPTAHRYYAGGGRVGLERDALVQAGGVEVLIKVFRDVSIVGQEMSYSYDARDLSPEIVQSRLAPCWNEALSCLRELFFSIPSLADGRTILDNEFLPFLFTLLSHDSCFDSAAALIEEILALLSQTPQQQMMVETDLHAGEAYQPLGRLNPPVTFYLGNVPNLYRLWAGFTCRQLAHFCRILALLIFEPEDRQLLESPSVLKSLELLQLRRNRAVRASRDSTVDMNQSILLGDPLVIKRIVLLLRVMNFAPSLRRVAPYHVMAQYPLVADTLVMLGLGEFFSWSEIDRQEQLARQLLETADPSQDPPLLCELGRVAGMLEGLSDTLSEAPNQIGHIIHVISAALQASVIVGRSGNRRAAGGQAQELAEDAASTAAREVAAEALRQGGVPVDNATLQGLASVAGILTDQVLVRRLYETVGQDGDGLGDLADDDDHESRHFINTPEDSSNSLQFNAILLGSYQVEVLFVLCTLLGSRRKLDAQVAMDRLGLVQVLEEMFERLPWFASPNGEDATSDRTSPGEQANGIHGPGCECTPESALCVQYLRLLHNFCDRDCDNYSGRRLLLSSSERKLVFQGEHPPPGQLIKPGLLTKVNDAFMKESDESPYRFWLASCIEAYLRGSSPQEQLFVAQSGLLNHLIEDVSSDRLHCAGSLQTSFDLLGELGKGNAEVVQLLVGGLDERRFRKLMSVAASNLVDSNVFIRSLLLSLERLSCSEFPLYMDGVELLGSPDGASWTSQRGSPSRTYLTHSWWDTPSYSLLDDDVSTTVPDEEDVRGVDECRASDWFPTLEIVEASRGGTLEADDAEADHLPMGLEESVGHFGWVFAPAGDMYSPGTYQSNTIERLSWFLAANQARLLRDLLGVVDLRNINHENICCLNTAVVVATFAHRHHQLPLLLTELGRMNDEEKETKRRAVESSRRGNGDGGVDRAFAQAMRSLDFEGPDPPLPPPYGRMMGSAGRGGAGASPAATIDVTAADATGVDGATGIDSDPGHRIGDRKDAMRNFREVLWFWTEYYTHRGRDRLSLEFSSHLRFSEWHRVVQMLSSDDGSPTSLVRSPPRLPRSPYQRSPRVADAPSRGI